MTITFADGITYPILTILGRTELVSSLPDLIAKSDRNILEIHFDSTVLDKDSVFIYYKNATELTHTITIADDEGQSYTHLDYVIPVKFSFEYFGSETNPRIVLVLAQLTETDKSLREVAGMTKVYTGTELEIAVAKKVDELSDICTQTIYDGADVTLADGTVEHFTLDEQDQLNLSGVGLELLMGEEIVSWHEDDETIACKFYSAADATTIIKTLTANKKYHITYFRDLRIYVNSLATVEEVNAIEYGFALPDEFKSEVLMAYEQQFNIGL